VAVSLDVELGSSGRYRGRQADAVERRRYQSLGLAVVQRVERRALDDRVRIASYQRAASPATRVACEVARRS